MNLCLSCHLANPLTGQQCQHVDNENDRVRDEYMRDAGFSVIRFWSADALRQRNVVCETILAALDGRLSEDVVASDLRYVYGAVKNVKE